jgi:C-terminal processing protease CtpA/Prc
MFKKVIISGLLIASQFCTAQNKYEEDFLKFWNDYKEYYAYFGKQRVDWKKVKDIYLPLVNDIKDDDAFIHFLEQVTYELHNGHISLNTNLNGSNRIIPSGADVFAEKKGNRYFIVDVRKESKAALSGLKSGMEIAKFNGKPVVEQLEQFLPKYTNVYDESMYAYALNMLLAGTHDKQREIIVIENGTENTYYPDQFAINNVMHNNIEYRILDGNIGYIKINNSLGENKVIKEFDDVLDKLMDSKSIILDLTETPGGGNTTVARGIMGRFTDNVLPYQKHQVNEKEFGVVRSWVEYVTPRTTIYKRKLTVMVGHWTGSMGEGMAIGFDAMKRAKIVGTKMAGLIGAIYTFKMHNTGIGYQIPYEILYHVNGTPREDFVPQYLTKNGDETYAKALKLAK